MNKRFDLEIMPISQINNQLDSYENIVVNSYKSLSSQSFKNYSPNNRLKFKKNVELANITNLNHSTKSALRIKIQDLSDLKIKCNLLSPKKKPHISETKMNMSIQQNFCEDDKLTRKSKLINRYKFENKPPIQQKDFENIYKENKYPKKNISYHINNQKYHSYHAPYYNTSIVFSKSPTTQSPKNPIFQDYKAEKIIQEMQSPFFSPRFQQIMSPPLNLQVKKCKQSQKENEIQKIVDYKSQLQEIYNGKFKICKNPRIF